MNELQSPFNSKKAFSNNAYWCKKEIFSIFIDLSSSGILQALGIKEGWKTITLHDSNNKVLNAVKLKVSISGNIKNIYIFKKMDETFTIYATTKSDVILKKAETLLPGEVINAIYYFITNRVTSFVNVF